jgi:hypothetical protein
MNTDQLRERFPDENVCRTFFESIIWSDGRFCPHCGFERTYHIVDKNLLFWEQIIDKFPL